MIDIDEAQTTYLIVPKITYSARFAYGAITINGLHYQPNWFHRLVHRLLLGIEWSRHERT
jgi:hypothetical protein